MRCTCSMEDAHGASRRTVPVPRYSCIPSRRNLLTSAHTYVSHQHAYNIRVINVWLPTYRSLLPPRAARFLPVLFPITLLSFSLSRNTVLCHRWGAELPPRRLSFLVVSPLCYDAAGFVNNSDSSRSKIFIRLCALFPRASRWLALQINRTAYNVVRHIVTAVECESQLLDSIKGIYSCFKKKNSVEKV